jgi:hypothetical protein
MKIPESIRELIAKAPFGHLTTLNSTGGPQVTVVWVGIEGEDFVIGHPAPAYLSEGEKYSARSASSAVNAK